MTTFEEFLAPFSASRFRAEHLNRAPLHVSAEGSSRRGLLDWAAFNALLAETSTWSPQTLKLVLNGEPVPADQYCAPTLTQGGTAYRPQPARVEVLMSTGASVIADEMQYRTPALSAVTQMLGQTFAAAVGVNAYCSFGGVQAFATHYDMHDVFAVHLEGEKTWRLYENREDSPVSVPPGDPRPFFEARRGRLMQEVRMRPGDLLYLPRGWYHDALADGDRSAASLHVSFSVSPLTGRALFELLERAALRDPTFRAYLPPADEDDGHALADRLIALGERMAALTRMPELRHEIAAMQTRLTPRPAAYALPALKPLTVYERTATAAPAFDGPEALAMHWLFAQPRFALEDFLARFDGVPVERLRAGVARAEASGAVRRL